MRIWEIRQNFLCIRPCIKATMEIIMDNCNNGDNQNRQCPQGGREKIVVETEDIHYLPDEAASRRLFASAATVRHCTIAAFLIGLLPLPFSDAPFLIITQYIMLKRLCDRYGREPGLSLALIIASALIGPLAFNALVKLIPLAGSLIGGCVAGGLTWYIGQKMRGILEDDLPFTWQSFKTVDVKSIMRK